MCRAGVSVRRVENITGALWGRRANLGAITGLNQNISERVEEWRKRPLVAEYPCVSVDGVRIERSRAGEVQNVPAPVTIDVSSGGFRELPELRKERAGTAKAGGNFYGTAPEDAALIGFAVIHTREGKGAVRRKAAGVLHRLKALRLNKAASIVETGSNETLPYHAFPPARRRHIRSGSPLERLDREICRRRLPGQTCGPDAGPSARFGTWRAGNGEHRGNMGMNREAPA
ncbi:transposase [uncultured Desulfovibrio sp.]|uniref:transposase n=1 Tax=uncultured Desulfovibrio sp. TaxID=167968 RepID=UPI00261857A9|nr:transposase [uncultured Desulfovibrio sp.]